MDYWGTRFTPRCQEFFNPLFGIRIVARAPVIHIQDYSTGPASPYHEDQPSHAFPKATGPVEGETVIAKRTSSAFASSNLEQHLREAGLNRLVFCGVHTNKCVESTVRSASDCGFEPHLVADATWTVDMTGLDGRVRPADEVHQMSLATLAGAFARVVGTAEAISTLKKK